MKMMLSMPRTISSAVSVRNASQTSGVGQQLDHASLPSVLPRSPLAPRRPQRGEDADREEPDDHAERDRMRNLEVVMQDHLHADEARMKTRLNLMYRNIVISPATAKYSERRPRIANAFEVKTMNGSLGHGEDRRDRVDREHDVGEVDHQQRHEQRRREQLAVAAHEETCAVAARACTGTTRRTSRTGQLLPTS